MNCIIVYINSAQPASWGTFLLPSPKQLFFVSKFEIQWYITHIIIKIRYTVPKLVWRNHPPPFDPIQYQLLHFSKNLTSFINSWKYSYLGFHIPYFFPSSSSKISLRNLTYLKVYFINWALLFLKLFYKFLFL